jgi:hypothetical protein
VAITGIAGIKGMNTSTSVALADKEVNIQLAYAVAGLRDYKLTHLVVAAHGDFTHQQTTQTEKAWSPTPLL